MALTQEAQKRYGIVVSKNGSVVKYNIGRAGFEMMVADYPQSLQYAASKTGIMANTLLAWKRQWSDIAWPDSRVPGDLRGRTKGVFKQLEERYSKEELEALAKGRSTPLVNQARKLVDFNGEVLTFGYYTDTHIGSKYFSENWFASMWAEFKRQKVNMVNHTGDVFEGLSNRPGHYLECDHIGYQAQFDYAVKIYSKYSVKDIPQNFIDGNHDRWFGKSAGAEIVNNFCKEMGYNYLGSDEGDILLDKFGVVLKLFHGEDGNSYATSYRIQKLVESFSGGEKPHVLLSGHTHKSMFAHIRNVLCVSGGSLSHQSKWMRSKRLENHAGFWIVKIGLGKHDIKWIEPRWYPFYR